MEGRRHEARVSRGFEREALGVPMVPSGRVTRMVAALRRRLAKVYRRTAPPPLQILETMLGQLDGHVLSALVTVGVPDQLEKSMAVDVLAERVGADPGRLERVLRYGAARGFVSLDRKGRVKATRLIRSLRSDAVAPWHAWVRMAGSDWFTGAMRALPDGLVEARFNAFEHAHGVDFFTYLTVSRPEAGELFDEAMAAGATLQAIGLARELEWDGLTSVCDVGGGTGAALAVLQQYHPHLDVTLFDRPSVVARTRLEPRDTAPGRRIIESGTFFTAVPPGRDRYLLSAVIHDWDDLQAGQILTNVASVLGSEGRAVVVENVAAEKPTDDFAAASDLLMSVLATGRERTDDEYRELFGAAGLAVVNEYLLPSGSTAYELATGRR